VVAVHRTPAAFERLREDDETFYFSQVEEPPARRPGPLAAKLIDEQTRRALEKTVIVRLRDSGGGGIPELDEVAPCNCQFQLAVKIVSFRPVKHETPPSESGYWQPVKQGAYRPGL
jgi:hypothetical protein